MRSHQLECDAETLAPALPDTLIGEAIALLKDAGRAGLKLATAESCTGGLLSSLLTDVEGTSHVFDRGFVTYSKRSKCDLLGVPAGMIRRLALSVRKSQEQWHGGPCGDLTRPLLLRSLGSRAKLVPPKRLVLCTWPGSQKAAIVIISYTVLAILAEGRLGSQH